MIAHMTAAVLYGKEDLRLERVPVPQPGPGELVVRVGAALTCGTDLKVYRRGYHALMLKPPIPFGPGLAGAGAIGLMFMHVAELAGVKVIAVVKREDQIATARLFGASSVLQVGVVEDVVAATRELTCESRGADVVIDAVASPAAWEWAVDMV